MLFLKLRKRNKPVSVPVVEVEKTILKKTEKKTIKEKPVVEVQKIEKPVKETKRVVKKVEKVEKVGHKEKKEKATKEISIDELFQREGKKTMKKAVEEAYEETSSEEED